MPSDQSESAVDQPEPIDSPYWHTVGLVVGFFGIFAVGLWFLALVKYKPSIFDNPAQAKHVFALGAVSGLVAAQLIQVFTSELQRRWRLSKNA